MPPDELIPHDKDVLSLGKANPNEITSRMAEDLLIIRKNDVLDDAVVHFKCKNLEEALREELDIRDRPIMRSDLVVREEINLMEKQILDIAPLEEMTQLKILMLSENQISDISPLKG